MEMEQDGKWGDQLILCAAADLYETTIYVINSESRAYDVTINPRESRSSKHLVLGHVSELLYVSLRPTGGNAFGIFYSQCKLKKNEINLSGDYLK